MIGGSYYWIFFIIFLIFFHNFLGLFYLTLENCVCFWNIFTILFFFHTFSRFATQVYRFYRNFLVFHFFHLFSAFLFYANAFLLNFIDYFPENDTSGFNWIAAYIFGVCSNLFLQVCCVNIFGIEEEVCFRYFCTLFIMLYTLFRFLTQGYRYFCFFYFFSFWHLFLTFSLIATSLFSFFDFVTRILIVNLNW